ncbi:hypothetical protein [Rhizobium laguerreae]|uniref:hypothetical protein n=1 Tax=Rhizobium laguerreae TaxID=1076926 RepID=UPI001C8FB853|nr:hypothetical protein [Rhizobium laguerreae]MBY3369072.1 hypothetical protein [Rhizobium laguerreae]
MRKGQRRIELPKEIVDLCVEVQALPDATSKAVRIGRLPRAVGAMNAIADSLPGTYHWRYKTAAAFAEEAETLAYNGGGPSDLNRLYWRDTLGTIEAYTVMAAWRMVDIAGAAFALLESEAHVPAGILARSALESAIQFVHDARTISHTLNELMKLDLTTTGVQSETLEAFLLQSVYASRQSDADEIYRSKNILTVIEKIAKLAKDDPIAAEYEVLCELTHPNFLGRSNYLVGVEAGARPGDEMRLIAHQNGVNSNQVLQSTLWSLSWAIEGQATSIHLVQSSVRDMFAKFPFLAAR